MAVITEKQTLKQVTPPAKTTVAPALPKEVAETTFSVSDFEVEQLPEQGTVGEQSGDKGTTSEKGGAKQSSSSKPGVAEESPQRSGAERGDDETAGGAASGSERGSASERGGDGASEVAGDGDEDDSTSEGEKKLPKFMKAPKKEGEVEQKGEVTKPIVPSKSTRDYSGLTDEEVKAGKNMSTEAFNIFKKAITVNKELAAVKDQTYLQHPQAYVLDPGYQEVQSSLSFAKRETAHWEQQLINMDAGQELVPLTGFNAKTGEPIYGQPIKPSKALEEKVRMIIHNCYNQAQQMQGKLQEYPNKYKETVNKDLQNVEAYRKQQFGWVNDPSLLDYTIPVEGLGERSLKQIKEDVTAILPKWMHNHPLTSVVGDLVIALRIKQAELAEAASTQSVASIKKSEQDLVEPSSVDKGKRKGKGEKVHGVDEFVIDPTLGV
jgi:hypothetical protein